MRLFDNVEINGKTLKFRVASQVEVCTPPMMSAYSKKVFKRPFPVVNRVNVTWHAFALSLITILPKLFNPGLETEDKKERDTAIGLTQIYRWSISSFLNCGLTWWTKRMKVIKNQCLALGLNSISPLPNVLPGTIGKEGPRRLTFPWARGLLRGFFEDAHTVHKSDTVSRALLQVYSSGRAFSLPDDATIQASLAQHRIDYSTDVDLDARTCRIAKKIAKAYAQILVLKQTGTPINRKGGKIPIRTSVGKKASRQSTVREGGKINDVKAILDKNVDRTLKLRFYGEDLYSYFGEIKIHTSLVQTLYPGISKGDFIEIPMRYWYLKGSEMNMVNHQFVLRDLALESLINKDLIQMPKTYFFVPIGSSNSYIGVYRGKPHIKRLVTLSGRVLDTCSIKERGFKSRIITVSDWEYPIISHYLRSAQQTLMGFDDTVPSLTGESSAVEGCRRKFSRYHQDWRKLTFEKYTKWLEKYLLSTDLSRCSDLILPSLSRALQEGFNEGADIYKNKFLLHISTLLYAERTITYEKGPEELPELTKARLSPLMGDPSTWIVNNLYTKFVVLVGRYRHRLPADQKPFYLQRLDDMSSNELISIMLSQGLAVYCGDDVLADVKSPDEAESIKRMFVETGGKISDGTDILSSDRAVFCEFIFKKGFMEGQGSYLQFQDVVRIKQLTRPQTVQSFQTVPPCWTIGKTSQNSLKYINKKTEEGLLLYNTMIEVIVFNNHRFIQDCRRFGLKAFFPTELGGAGYPVNPDKFTDFKNSTLEERRMFCLLDGADFSRMTPHELFKITSLSDIFSAETEATEHGAEDHQAIESVLQKVNYLSRSDAIELVDSRYKNLKPWMKTRKLEISFVDPDTDIRYLPLGRFIKFLRLRLISNRGLLFEKSISRDPPSLTRLKEVFDTKWREISEIVGADVQQQVYTDSVSLSTDWDCINRLRTVVSGIANQVYIDNRIINEMHPKLTKEIPWNPE